MNERIEELAKQAVFESYEAGCIDQKEILLEKFAELIVKECAMMADEFELDVNRSGLVDRMKKHFGVEDK
jgi:hypothetical protein